MIKALRCLLLIPLLWLAGCSPAAEVPALRLSEDELAWVGAQIFRNECASRPRCLVHWNEGEAFPSLGIGHFIWYPSAVDDRFVESFPELVAFMTERGVTLPPWLAELSPLDAPWPDRASFLAQADSPRVVALRDFLQQHQGVQAEFIFARAQTALTRVLAAAPESRRGEIAEQLAALSATPGGVYALLDYVNFKGEGLATGERYQGQGWGLLQVLQQMTATEGATALARFREAAAAVLTRRAELAPRAIERQRWLPGWLRRLQSYREPAMLEDDNAQS